MKPKSANLAQELPEMRIKEIICKSPFLIAGGRLYAIDLPESESETAGIGISGALWALYSSESLKNIENLYISENSSAIRKLISKTEEKSSNLKNDSENSAKTFIKGREEVAFAIDLEEGPLFRERAITLQDEESIFRMARSFGFNTRAKNSPLSGAAKNDEISKEKKRSIEDAIFSELLAKGESSFEMAMKEKAGIENNLFISDNGMIYLLNQMKETEYGSMQVAFEGRKYSLKSLMGFDEFSNKSRDYFIEMLGEILEKHVSYESKKIGGRNIKEFESIAKEFEEKGFYENGDFGIKKEGADFYLYKWINNRKPYSLIDPSDSTGYAFQPVRIATLLNKSGRGEILKPSSYLYVIESHRHPFLPGDGSSRYSKICCGSDSYTEKEIDSVDTLAAKYIVALNFGESNLLCGYRGVNTPYHRLNENNYFSNERSLFEKTPADKKPVCTNLQFCNLGRR
ncbi:MAG: hypothetical protein NTV63_01155 [Candidatus Woesearchaeota archaeon]|nr:hypothetical protein [Candidatus Woesearchaeota archaeon]